MPYITDRPPKKNILRRIIKYLFFNFILTTSPILINLFISFTEQLPYKSTISYCPDICFMTIVTASSSIRDSLMSKTIKKDDYILGGVIVFNILFMLLSIIIYGNITKDTLSPDVKNSITIQQFCFSLVGYILSVLFGLGIQIGGGIDD
ncbi:MAG: hypothetical protein HDR14_02590 [Lachnospiraceae bacterium]|nr:hypothetical protein [Lachnospiraceae bacterium]